MTENKAKNPRLALHLGEELRAWLKNMAKEHGRSMSSEVIQILKRERNRTQSSQAYNGLEPF
ncbi:Arc family DNA-binding protein [uncultured Thiothrix sp.]|uniref:Arc family DNA-binding protein n=1 Tax=uncultured Thiothrix sp. TaxID=223185 RepID=UPI00260974CA|nr:Arc family DNA-binding protein [uncultured Thiothrix sp.]